MMTISIYRALLYTQWKQQRFELLAFAVIGAMAPPLAILSLRVGAPVAHSGSPWPLLGVSPIIGTIGEIVAILVGALLAIRPFSLDAATRHTYALALPIRRSSYALLRAGTGLSLLLLPTLGFLIGALIAANAIALPAMLHAYPIGLTIRFLLAGAITFSFAFALQYWLGDRAAPRVLLTIGVIAVIEIASQLTAQQSIIGPVLRVLGGGISPFRIFATDWTLFDV